MSTKTQGPVGATGKTGAVGPAGPAGASGVAATSEHFAKIERELAELKHIVAEQHDDYERHIGRLKTHVASDIPDVKALRDDLSALETVVASRRTFWQDKSAHEEATDRTQEGA